jgi:hypothetical protein
VNNLRLNHRIAKRAEGESTRKTDWPMKKTLKFVAIVSFLFGILAIVFCLWFYFQLPHLEPGTKVSVEMYQNLFSAIKVLVFKVILYESTWLLFASVIAWKCSSKLAAILK